MGAKWRGWEKRGGGACGGAESGAPAGRRRSPHSGPPASKERVARPGGDG